MKMTISITVGSSAGVNVNMGADHYFADLASMFAPSDMNFGYFYKTMTNASEYGLAETKESSVFTGGSALLATGNLSYNLSKHTVTGRLDSLAFGSELEGVSGGFGTTSTKMSLATTDLSFTSLGLDASDGDAVHDILYGLMTGDASNFLSYLKTQSVKFTGGAGADSYQGGSKADTLSGLGGKDTLSGGAGDDTISGGSGADMLTGNTGNDVLSGGTGADTILGHSGNDTLNGGTGADTLTGGSGADRFIFKALSDSASGAIDVITDFSTSSGDLIDLSSLDADSATAKNQSFDFIGTAAFSGEAGELRYVKSKTGTDVYADVDGDKKSDFTLHFDDSLTLKAAHFDL
jgi:Ca2+-binding RTX toxin-like protein